jgi:hypothetical protein
MDNTDFYVYYKQVDNDFCVLQYSTGKITIHSLIPKDLSHFELSGNYEATEEDLVRYSKDLFFASEELKTSKFITFDYIQPFVYKSGNKFMRSHTSNIESIFKMTCKGKYENFEPISGNEALWMNKCYNTGLMYTTTGTHQSYGYDFKNYYASILASKNFYFPIRQGTEYTLEAIPKKLKFGFYHVLITSEDPNIKKLFSFSTHHIYNSNSLMYALELQKTNKYEVKIELIQDKKPNAYLYEMKDMITGDKVFGKWYDTILKLKKAFPKNILTKMLSSSLWGHLSKFNVQYLNEEDAEKLNIGITDKADYYIIKYDIKKDGTGIYTLMDNKQPFKYNLRLKPFVTAHGRNQTARIVAEHIDDVLRVHTDGICFSKPLTKDIDNFVSEDKTTGLIEFNNINNYKLLKPIKTN